MFDCNYSAGNLTRKFYPESDTFQMLSRLYKFVYLSIYKIKNIIKINDLFKHKFRFQQFQNDEILIKYSYLYLLPLNNADVGKHIRNHKYRKRFHFFVEIAE